VYDMRHAIEWPDGRRVFLSINGAPLLDSLGEVESAVFTYEDITEHIKADQRLHKELARENLLVSLFEKAHLLSDQELYEYVMECAVQLTESSISFFHLISDNQQTINLTAWNSAALKNCVVIHETHYPVEQAGNRSSTTILLIPPTARDSPRAMPHSSAS
jgi:hypothetical protein